MHCQAVASQGRRVPACQQLQLKVSGPSSAVCKQLNTHNNYGANKAHSEPVNFAQTCREATL